MIYVINIPKKVSLFRLILNKNSYLCKNIPIMSRNKKTYQTCLDPHDSAIVDEIARRTGCSTSAVLRQAAKMLTSRYDTAHR